VPIYEFQCPSCDLPEDRILPLEHEEQKCEVCGKTLRKLMSIPAPPIFANSVDAMERNASKHKKRVRDQFAKTGRDEAIAGGGTEWKYGKTTDEIEKNTMHKNLPRTTSEIN
jgi:putative FmdB family regulatory protein